MRTSTRTPRLSWFKCFPADFVSDSRFLAMSALARGVYWSMILYGWNDLCRGNGLPANAESLQRISAATPLEWDSVKTQVLALFELRNGMYYLPWLVDAATEASEKYQKQKDASEKAADARKNNSPNPPQEKSDEIDESRLDKNGRPNGHQQSTSTTPSVKHGGVSSPHDSPTSGRLAAPASGVPLPDALKAPHESLDIEKIREHAFELGWKMPGVDHVQGLLAEGSVEDVCEAMDEYDGNLNGGDSSFAQYRFFAEGGGLTVMHVIANRGVHR